MYFNIEINILDSYSVECEKVHVLVFINYYFASIYTFPSYFYWSLNYPTSALSLISVLWLAPHSELYVSLPCERCYQSVNNINGILINLVEISVCLYFICIDYHFDNISTRARVSDHIIGREEPVHPCGNTASAILQISGRQHAAFITLLERSNSRVNKSANHL